MKFIINLIMAVFIAFTIYVLVVLLGEGYTQLVSDIPFINYIFTFFGFSISAMFLVRISSNLFKS